jgi:prephenate dehydrogenase
MTPQISIIGLGQIGASIGMALRDKKSLLRRVGFDRDTAVARAAESLGAVDELKPLGQAVKAADIVLLCLPLSEIYDTLQRIGPDLKENAIVMDTAPVKSGMMEWARDLIPAGRSYLGLVPSVTVNALTEQETGLKAARPDLFKRTVMIVDAPSGTPAEVEEFAVGFVKMLGAKPMLADIGESDGFMAAAHLLPQLAAAALLEATVDQPGWADGRKMAGRPFVGMTGGIAYYDDPASLKTAALANPAAVLHPLDMMIASLRGLRDDIQNGDEESVSERLEHAFNKREQWLDERGAANWLSEGGAPVELPDIGEQVMQMFFGSRIADRTKKKKQ